MADIDVTSEEEWRAIPGFPEYEVSSLGRIRSIPRVKPVLNRWGTMPLRKLQGRVLKPRLHTGGYLRISAGRQTDLFIHRVVAMAFHGQPPTPNHEVAHLNGNKKDNRPENLAWATPVENASHKIAHGTHSTGEKNGASKLKESQVVEIIKRYALGESSSSLAIEFNVSGSVIRLIIAGTIWKHANSEYRDMARSKAQWNIKEARNQNNMKRKIEAERKKIMSHSVPFAQYGD